MEPIPIEFREGKYIKIYGVPHDLTETEAEKISNIIKAMVNKEIKKLNNTTTLKELGE